MRWLLLALLLTSCVTVHIEVHTDCDTVNADVEQDESMMPEMRGLTCQR